MNDKGDISEPVLIYGSCTQAKRKPTAQKQRVLSHTLLFYQRSKEY